MISYNYLASPGQLGNQMFKYAALRGIAHNLNKDFMMPPSYPYLSNNKLLRRISIKTKLVDKKNKQNHLLFKYFKMGSVNKKNIGYSDTDIMVKENSFEFDDNIFNFKDDKFDIYGFFQSERYFKEVELIIKNDFQFKKNIDEKGIYIFKKLNNPVSIHVRRGDFLTNPNHNVLDLNYYEQGIELFDNREFLVFTDDINWCKNQKLFKSKKFIFAGDHTRSNEALDLNLMSKCNYHIIANSSFSWWGAWLSDKKRVIYPSNWFKNSKLSHLNTKDLIPEDWEKLEN